MNFKVFIIIFCEIFFLKFRNNFLWFSDLMLNDKLFIFNIFNIVDKEQDICNKNFGKKNVLYFIEQK